MAFLHNAFEAAFASRANSRYVLAGSWKRASAAGATTAPGRPCGHDHVVKRRLWVTIKPKYVNMADVNLRPGSDRAKAPDREIEAGEPTWDIIELLFFAYRDFIGDADEVLGKFGFGRAHHRVLHFVNRNPGMKVADLLDILRITKQSLGRVLKQLVDQGYVVQKEGPSDRRHRLLYVTAKGEALAMKLAALQSRRIAHALGELGPGAHESARRFLTAMMDVDGRDGVLRFVARADRARPQRA
jgi:DNA-binding MarR family transcriptional regulator